MVDTQIVTFDVYLCSFQLFDRFNCLMKLCFTGENNELDAVSAFSEIVPDTVVFDDFER